jgi:transposase InsO family protein
MTAAAVRVVVHDAVRLTGGSPEVMTDSGSQFMAKDFKELVRNFELEHIRIRTYHQDSNGKLELFRRNTREALVEAARRNLGRASEVIGRWVRHCNEDRLHAALNCLPPAEYCTGDPSVRLAKRRRNLAAARERSYERTAHDVRSPHNTRKV